MIAGVALASIAIVPLVAAGLSWIAAERVKRIATVSAGFVSFLSAIAITSLLAGGQHSLHLGSLLTADPLSAVFCLAATFLYSATSAYSLGYVKHRDAGSSTLFNQRFFIGLNIFCWAMNMATIVNGLALVWVAIEITTVISALLVALDDTDGATEASWKYMLIASMGLGLALLATVLIYAAGAVGIGHGFSIGFTPIMAAAKKLPPQMVRLAFVLAVLGYGTKMGLAPVHTWLPDAHSEAPTPISALLSGALLAVSFYAILRYFQVAETTLGPAFCRDVLLAFGLLSLLLASLYLASQRDLKRLLAYSSVEHMGILAIGMSFAAPIAITGVLLQVLAHACAKSTAFFGAGSLKEKLHTKDMTTMRGGIHLLPWSGTILLLAVLALSGLPPFAIFRSEFLIVQGGLATSSGIAASALVVLVTAAFFGLSWSTSRILLAPASRDAPRRGELSAWMVAPMVVGIGLLAVLGVHVPGGLIHLLHRAAAELHTPGRVSR
jgi:hydrogenase-4 component F